MSQILSNSSQAMRGEQPNVLDGYEHVHRYWDRAFACHGAKILPGEYYVSTQGEMITTVLGSCISACVRDVDFGVGGMNHFMLPEGKSGGDCASTQARYGSYAMETLINQIIMHGGRRRRLEVKLFGGGQVLDQMTDIGARNIAFVEEYVAEEGLLVTSRDVGDVYPRRVVFFPETGKAMVKRLRKVTNDTITERESKYREDLSHQPISSDIELF